MLFWVLGLNAKALALVSVAPQFLIVMNLFPVFSYLQPSLNLEVAIKPSPVASAPKIPKLHKVQFDGFIETGTMR